MQKIQLWASVMSSDLIRCGWVISADHCVQYLLLLSEKELSSSPACMHLSNSSAASLYWNLLHQADHLDIAVGVGHQSWFSKGTVALHPCSQF